MGVTKDNGAVLRCLSDSVHLELPTRIELIESTSQKLVDRAVQMGACAGDRAGNLLLVFTELLTNAMVHGNLEISSELKQLSDGAFARAVAQRSEDPLYASRTVDIRMEYDGERSIWTITDQGPGFDYQRVLDRLTSEPPDLDKPSGRGILLTRALTDLLEWDLGGRRVRVAVDRVCDGRREARTRVHTPLRVIPMNDAGAVDWSRAFDALAIDASEHGVGLLSHMATARRAMLELRGATGPVYVPVSVRYVNHLDGTHVQLGCELAEAPAGATADGPSSEPAARRLRALVSDGQSQEDNQDFRSVRRHPRTRYDRMITIYSGAGSEPMSGMGRNISVGGIGFLAFTPLQPGTEVEIDLTQDHVDLPRLPARVLRCTRLAEGIFDVGAQFL